MPASHTNRLILAIAGIQLAERRRLEATFFLVYQSMMDPNHLLLQLMVEPITVLKERLRCRHSIVISCLINLSIRPAQW